MLFHFVINLIVLIDLDEFNINKILITTTVLIIHAFPILGLIFLMILHIYLALSKKSTIGLILK
jgi:cytochrome b subunit of formate dehydrogenase